MVVIRFIEALQRRPRLIRWIGLAGLAALALWDALLLDKTRVHTGLERVPGWWSLFGLAACSAIIVCSKWLGSRGISTSEDYYD